MTVYCQTGTWRSLALMPPPDRIVGVLQGGYRAYLDWRADVLQRPLRLRVVGGETGTGKTEYLRDLAQQGEQVVDLEDLAGHRGSAFGRIPGHVKTPEQFLNDLAERMADLDAARVVWIEDKTRSLGRAGLPDGLWRQIQAAPLWLLTASREQRVQTLLDKYRSASQQDLLAGIARIRPRLGADRTRQAAAAVREHRLTQAADILLEYYDHAYQRRIQGRRIEHRLAR